MRKRKLGGVDAEAAAAAEAWSLLLGGARAFAICLDFGRMRYIV
jgi:hypothetical protein